MTFIEYIINYAVALWNGVDLPTTRLIIGPTRCGRGGKPPKTPIVGKRTRKADALGGHIGWTHWVDALDGIKVVYFLLCIRP